MDFQRRYILSIQDLEKHLFQGDYVPETDPLYHEACDFVESHPGEYLLILNGIMLPLFS